MVPARLNAQARLMVAPSVLSSFFATTCHVAPVARRQRPVN
jgi:hypothetical protein